VRRRAVLVMPQGESPHPGLPHGLCGGLHDAASSQQKLIGRLLSHAEPDYSGCCANGRNKYFAIIARDIRPFDVTQSCLPRIALRAWRARKTGWTLGTRRS
jgi:hypothetical protein